jgi:tRNA (cytidine32/guanosine34-2'-O)-methyltransferase
MAPLPNTTILCGDITLPQTVERMLNAMEGKKADLVVCDGAPEGETEAGVLVGIIRKNGIV